MKYIVVIKVDILYTVVMFNYYILPKCVKTREPKEEHCVLWCTYICDNIHDPIPLDKLKNHTALPYITIVTVLDAINIWGYYHFAKAFPTSEVEKESEQIQQMYNMDEEQTTLKLL